MRIEINLKIFFIIILFFLFHYLDTYVIFLIFVIIHEMSHLICGIIIGGKPKTMCFNPLGLSLEFYSYGKDNYLHRIILFLAGPLINFVIAIIFANYDILPKYNEKIIYTNFALGFFNLLPIIPLDGGKILLEIIKKFFGKEFASKYMLIFSKTFLVIISFAYSIIILKIKNIFFLILLLYLWWLYITEERKYNLYERVKQSLKLKYWKLYKLVVF